MPLFTTVDFDPFAETKEIERITFTNEPQREIWLACIIGGTDANLSYNESVSLTIKGNLNFSAFKRAVNDLVLRHEALRATISPNGETLIIYRDFPVELELEDISGLSETEKNNELSAFLHREMDTPLNLQDGPLFRVFMQKTGENEFYFTIIKHHIIGDGWSTGIMLEDLGKMYNAYSKGEDISLDAPYQISDYAASQANFEASPEHKETVDYWLNLYKDNVPLLDLPTDHPRTAPRPYTGNRIDRPLSNEMGDKLKTIGAKAGCSLVTTLLAAFEVFLFDVTHQDDIVVGLPASGQAASGLTDVVGHCVNLLPLKTHIDPKLSFTDYLKKRKGEVLDAYDHQRFTFGELIKKLYIQRDPSRLPLVPVIFNIDMGMDNAVSFDGLDYKLISNPRAYEIFEIFLNATRSKDGIVMEWSYNTGLFDAATIQAFNDKYHSILEQIIDNPLVSIANLAGIENKPSIVTVAESVYISPDENINTLLEATAKRYASKNAVSVNNQVLTYQQLNEKVSQLVGFLVKNGIGVGDIVALSIDRSVQMLVSMLAVLRVGAVYLPLDPEYPLDRIEFMLEDSAAKMLLVSKKYKNSYKSKSQEIVVDEIWPGLNNYPAQTAKKDIDGNSIAYIIYTSGSTGKPKGVKITHRNLVNFLLSMQKKPGITDADRLLAITTIAFDIAGLELYLPLISGAELVIADAEATKDGRLLLNIIETKSITIMQATPSTWQMTLDAGWEKRFPIKVLAGGEALPKDLAEKILKVSWSLWNMYGPTETTIWSTIKQVMPEDRIITVGSPIANTQVYIVDEGGKQVYANETGEIYIGGDGVTDGYLNREELNAEKFVADTFSNKPGAKLYRTGDLGKILYNGEIQCLGRIDYQVKIRGHRIELGEIEVAIAKQDGIKQSVVLAREDTPMNKRLIAYVTLADEADKNDNSWKDRWDTLYNIGAENKQKLAISDQHIDGTLLEQLENSEDLTLQAAEWLQSSIGRIKQLKSKRIYEIGSGAGQILFELAPGIEAYIATDFAQTAINKLNEQLQAEPQKWSHVRAQTATADDFSAVAGESVDLVLIHSVAQYFPNTDYLISVIRESAKAIKHGGCIFVGDMQGKNSLEMFHAMDHLPRALDTNSIASFKAVVANRVRIEDEFVADPAFFYSLPRLIPEITGVNVQLRKGQSLNEITKYHYDVWLYVNTPVNKADPEVVADWKDINSTDKAEKLLTDNPSSVVEIKNILNSRTARDHRLLKLLSSADPEAPLIKIKNEVDKVNDGIHPDLLWELGEQLNYDTHVRWTTDGTDGLFDVVFVPASSKLTVPAYSSANTLNGDPHAFARTPAFKNEVHIAKETIQQWKDNLNEVLPAYMVPEDFIGMRSFPLTPNAKIDRKALPKPQPKRNDNNDGDRVKLTKNEKLVKKIWEESLGLENLKPGDDFFELGGHSLLAVKVMVSIEKMTGKRLPLATLFTNPTIEKLARKLSGDNEPLEKWESIVPIKTTGSKYPIFLIHGGGLNVLLFKSIIEHLDEDQPVYGIQALGLYYETDVPPSFEAIATRYINDILKVNPDGPYAFVGYSVGGVLAFEVAKQLHAMGKEIKLVGVMDTYAGKNVAQGDKLTRISKKIKRQFRKIPFIVKSFIKYPKESLEYQFIVMKQRYNGVFSSELITPDVLTEYEQGIYRIYDRAHNDYILNPSDLRVTLFRVTKRLYFLDDLVYLGWADYAQKGVEVHEIKGDHKTFLFPPIAEKFAHTIQHLLDTN